MEAAELILTFIADIIHYIAWPAVVITMFVLVRQPIKALIDRIKQARVKKGDTEVTFDMMAETMKVVNEETPNVIPLADLTPDNLDWPSFRRSAITFTQFMLTFLISVPLDYASEYPPFIRLCIYQVE